MYELYSDFSLSSGLFDFCAQKTKYLESLVSGCASQKVRGHGPVVRLLHPKLVRRPQLENGTRRIATHSLQACDNLVQVVYNS